MCSVRSAKPPVDEPATPAKRRSGPGRPPLGESTRSAAERKRLERQRLAQAHMVRFEVRMPEQVYAKLEQLQGPGKASSRDQVVQAAISAAFARLTPTAAVSQPGAHLDEQANGQ